MTFDLVYYGKFSGEYVETMTPFERDYYHERSLEVHKDYVNFMLALHDKKIK
jgi:hypothetical protein